MSDCMAGNKELWNNYCWLKILFLKIFTLGNWELSAFKDQITTTQFEMLHERNLFFPCLLIQDGKVLDFKHNKHYTEWKTITAMTFL